jgi:conjugative relaxase-like TrwC/TraI family protein
MLTISRLSKWSIGYYNDTANAATQATLDRQKANGGLGEYYSEADTRVPTWLITGDAAKVAKLTDLGQSAQHGGFADPKVAADWLNEGVAPNGSMGRAFSKTSVHGFDLTFAAPKSVSLFRALTDDIGEKVLAEAHMKAIGTAMAYLHAHAGYTRTYNPLSGYKDLERLPGIVAITYQHETSRAGDPHLHTHVIVPNRQPRRDGMLVSLDSKSLYHEAKAAGSIYQAVLRQSLHAELGIEWNKIDEHTGMAEIAGVGRDCIKAWSQRSTRLREWARNNLVLVDGEPTPAQLAAAQKATRPPKPEPMAWATLKEIWRADPRGLVLHRDAHYAAKDERLRANRAHRGDRADGVHDRGPDRLRIAAMAAHIDKPAFTRADMVELVGAQIPIDAPGDPRRLIEDIVDAVSVRVSAPRLPHQREGHEKYTVDAVMAEEDRVLGMVDDRDNRSRLDVRDADLGDLSPDQQRAIRSIATSSYLIQPLQAPAGAGKTHSLKALRAAAHRADKEVLVLAPTGKAVDAALQEGAGDRGLTVAKVLQLIECQELHVNRRIVVVVDEASMLGTPDLKKLLSWAAAARSKMVLVGDAYQLAPVRARGGMFEQLCAELPWAQRLAEVWRMRDRAERDASLALRSAHGNRLRKAVGWYRTHDRLHTGDPVAMAADAQLAYLNDRAAGHDALLICDTWEMADALNRRLHGALTKAGPTVRVGRDQSVRFADLIVSRNNDASIAVAPGPGHRRGRQVDQVRNGNRWRITAVDAANRRISAERTTDAATAVFEGEYLSEHVTLGYAVTVHSAQGVTADTAHAIVGEGATRAMLYVGMTRGREHNHAYIYQRLTGEADHEHATPVARGAIHKLRRGDKYAAAHHFRAILARDDRPRTMHAEAERADRALLPHVVAQQLERQDRRRAARSEAWRQHNASARARSAAFERMAERTGPEQGLNRETGLER